MAWGTSSDSNSSRLGFSSVSSMLAPVRLPLGRARPATRPIRRVGADNEDNRDRRGRLFCRQCRWRPATRRDHVDLATDEIRGQRRQLIIVALGPAVFDRYVLFFEVAGLAQSSAERGQIRGRRTGRPALEVADYRHRLLLRTRGGWTSTHCAGE
jgi:hypothetical protein